MNGRRVPPLLLSMILLAMGAGEDQEPYRDGERVNLEGTVHLVGNEPFTRLVLRPDEGPALFLPQEMLRRRGALLGRRVRVEAVVEVRVLESADRKVRVTEYHLRNVVIGEP